MGFLYVVEELLYIICLLLFVVKEQYDVLYNFFKIYGGEEFDRVVVLGIKCDDVIVNLFFFFGFNVYGGFNFFFL